MYANLSLPLLGLAAGVTEAFFVMSCPGRLVRERLDPIVNPGGLAGHVHQIAGGAGFSAEMSYDDARAAKCTSCPIKVCDITAEQSVPIDTTTGGSVQLLDS